MMYPDEDDPAIGRRDDRKSPNGVSVPINECRKLGSDRCVENDRNWVAAAVWKGGRSRPDMAFRRLGSQRQLVSKPAIRVVERRG